MVNKSKKKLQATHIIILGFFIVILVGALLLNLPMASNSGESIGVVDAIFTATSAVCVTGLVVVNTLSHWTEFGKLVILALIQIGGLGVMTLATSFFIILGKKIGFRERLIMQESLNQNSFSGVIGLTRNIFIGSLLIEAVGAFLLSFVFIPRYGFLMGIWKSIFHSISAFCNAGFDILGSNSISGYVDNGLVNITIMFLIILGGLGFNVWMDLLKTSKKAFENKWSIRVWFSRLSLHSKIVLTITGILILGGFLAFLLLEYTNPNTLGGHTIGTKFWGALFQSVTARTAGFNSIPLDKMTVGSKFIMIILMFIGGSPSGTAGGVKTVTMGVLYISMIATVKSKRDIEIFNRRIEESIVRRALAIIIISLNIVVVMTIILSITEATDFINVLFESVSAFATVGLTLGITSDLTVVGKIIISLTMFIGRLGPMTIAAGLAMRNEDEKILIKRPEEKVIVG